LFTDLLIIVGAFFLIGYSHSLLASNKIKQIATQKLGSKIAFYRLFYNLFAILSFTSVYYFLPKPQQIVYDLKFPFDIIVLVIQIIGLFGVIWAGSFIDVKEFLGINQIKRYLNGTYNLTDFDEKKELVITGAYKYMRHPIYFFSILFIGARPAMNVFSLTIFILAASYFVIGAYYEEKKLAEFFGEQYIEYQKNVPMIFPFSIFKSTNKNL